MRTSQQHFPSGYKRGRTASGVSHNLGWAPSPWSSTPRPACEHGGFGGVRECLIQILHHTGILLGPASEGRPELGGPGKSSSPFSHLTDGETEAKGAEDPSARVPPHTHLQSLCTHPEARQPLIFLPCQFASGLLIYVESHNLWSVVSGFLHFA